MLEGGEGLMQGTAMMLKRLCVGVMRLMEDASWTMISCRKYQAEQEGTKEQKGDEMVSNQRGRGKTRGKRWRVWMMMKGEDGEAVVAKVACFCLLAS